jgi:hypothetical protein
MRVSWAQENAQWRVLVWVTVLGACGFPRPADVVGDAESAGAADAAGTIDGAVDASTIDAFVAPPAITAFSPDWGSTGGGTLIRMLGFGFTGPHLTVKFGSSVAGQVTVVSDTELTVMTPVGPHAPVDVGVTTGGGTVSGPKKFRYLAPLYAADARGAMPGNLYIVDPATAASVTVGPLGVAVTGLALSPGGVLYGATAVATTGNTLVTIDPYTARVTTIGVLMTTTSIALWVPDLTFAGTQLLGWSGPGSAGGVGAALLKINLTTGRATPFAAQAGASPSAAVASVSDGTVLVVQNHNLSSVNTTNGSLVTGPALSNNAGANGLTFVGGTLYASQPTSMTPRLTTLVTINPTTGVVTAVGPLPPSTDAIVGIPSPSILTGSVALAVDTASVPLAQRAAATPRVEMLRVAGHSLPVRDVLALGRDVAKGARVRRITPLAALARLGLGGEVVLVSQGGEMHTFALNAPGLALTENHRHQLKLVNTREGFHQIFAPIVEIRRSDDP